MQPLRYCLFASSLLLLRASASGAAPLTVPTGDQNATTDARLPFELELNYAYNSLAGGGHAEAHDGANMASITMVCVVMYGVLGAFWVFYLGLPERHPQRDMLRTGLLCLSWSSASVGMSMLNKGLISDLQAPALMAICQMVITFFATLGASYKHLLNSPPEQLRMWMLVPVLFAGVLCTSFYTLKFISLSVLTLVRNLAPLLILPVERMVMPPDKQPLVNYSVIVSILVMLLGAAVYCEGVQDISLVGVCFAVVNMLVAMVVRIMEKRLLTLECKDLTAGVCTCITNLVGIVPCLALAVAAQEFHAVHEHADVWSDPKVLFVLALSGFVGLGIGYFGYETQRVITATSMVVLQNVAKVATVSIGMSLFGDPITPFALAGIGLSILGSIFYGTAQLGESAAEAAERQSLVKERQTPRDERRTPRGEKRIPRAGDHDEA